jgi:peptidoglycan/xylan/chitin deacetylase (PgdA/CDA1 family)
MNSKLFRPPFGRIKPSQIRHLKKAFKIVMWDVLSWDFHKTTSAEKCFNIVMKKTINGSIIVFHENDKAIKNVKYCLPKMLEHFSKEGYEFKAITG